MPHRCDQGPDGLVLEAWWGEIGSEELLAHEAIHLRDAKPRRTARVIVDLRMARFDSSVGERAIEELTDLYREYRQLVLGAKVALIVASETDKVRLYEKYSAERGLNVVVFNSIEVACVWLGSDAGQVREWMHLATNGEATEDSRGA